MELMRHSDVRLTLSDYNDDSLLPLAREQQRIPSLESSRFSSLRVGKSCPSTIAGRSALDESDTESSESQGFRVALAGFAQVCPNGQMADREGFEPSRSSSQHTDNQESNRALLSPSSLISSLKNGSDCPELSEIEENWPFLSHALKLAILSIVRSIGREPER